MTRGAYLYCQHNNIPYRTPDGNVITWQRTGVRSPGSYSRVLVPQVPVDLQVLKALQHEISSMKTFLHIIHVECGSK